MKRPRTALMICCAIWLLPIPAIASPIVGFIAPGGRPSDGPVLYRSATDGNFVAFLAVEGLGSTLLGAFDATLEYGTSGALVLDDVAFGASLGDPDSDAITDFDENVATRTVNFFEVSLLDAAALDALQNPGDVLILAVLRFTTPFGVITGINLRDLLFSDELGNPIDVVAVEGSRVEVPEPGLFLLVSGGLGALIGRARCARSTRRSSVSGAREA